LNKTATIDALYERLSQEDELQGESNSIQNQKLLLERYAREHGFTNIRHYTDDGYSGANFERPGFKKMMADVEAGLVRTVIVKDMSRFGRDYLKVGLHTEITFPEKNIRFIAINDGVDSATGQSDFTVLRNVFNEWYCRDTSKKIRAVKRAKGMAGKPVTSRAPFGYLLDENGVFQIDPEAAPVVQKIYSLCLSGYGPTQIARMLCEQEIPTPGTLDYMRTGSTRRYYPDFPCKWATNTIVHILSYREYTGCLVNFKTTTKSYKCKKILYNDEDKQAVFEGAHTPIIDPDTWERVQKLREKRRRPTRYGEMSLFSGLLYCADCGHLLYCQRYKGQNGRQQDAYICGNYRKRTHDCTAHYITAKTLSYLVADNLRVVTMYAAKDEQRFIRQLMKESAEEQGREAARLKRELEGQRRRIAELDKIIKRLYEDNVTGKISDERYMMFSEDYEAEQKALRESVKEVAAKLERQKDEALNVGRFMEVVHKYMTFEELTPAMLREFVDRIIVHAPDDTGPIREQEIEIVYNFVGTIELAALADISA
jgi:site-specific DNA recombinase